MNNSYQYGDIIQYSDGKQYVFLALNLEYVFLALIVYGEYGTELQKLASLPQTDAMRPMFWFVTLTTDGFVEKLAHLNQPPKTTDILRFFTKIKSLNDSDKKDLKECIMRKGAPVPQTLPTLLKDIRID
jgi:hypothetical protein